ncbi:MAG: succinylglutamate desuccinylase [bacterium]
MPQDVVEEPSALGKEPSAIEETASASEKPQPTISGASSPASETGTDDPTESQSNSVTETSDTQPKPNDSDLTSAALDTGQTEAATESAEPSPAFTAPNIDLEAVASPVSSSAASAETKLKSIFLNDGTSCLIPEPEALLPLPKTFSDKKPFNILGTRVLPGTSTRLGWSAGDSISGLQVTTPVLVVNGIFPGPRLCLTAAIHGDEINGIEIIRRVIYDIDPEKLSGTIVGVPIVNLQGFQRGSRYLPDRRDLNRYFPGSTSGSLASRVANSLFSSIIEKCDMLIDFHTGSLRRSNLPQIRANMKNPQVVAFTEGFEDMLVVHSRGGKGMLRTAATEAGIPAITFEVGESLRLQNSQVETGVKGVLSLLKNRGMYGRQSRFGSSTPVYFKSTWVRAAQGGVLISDVRLGTSIRQNDILGTITDPITNERSEIHSPVNGTVIGMATNQVVMPGYAVYHVGIETSEQEVIESALEADDTEVEPEYINEEMEPEDE